MSETILAISHAVDVLELRELTRTALTELGWHAAYFIAPLSSDRDRGRLLANSGFPARWEDDYRAGLGRHDPMPDIAIQLAHPFAWHNLPPTVRLTDEDRAYLTRLPEWNMECGVGIATYGPSARAGFMGIGLPASREVSDRPDFDRLRIIAQTSFLRYCDLSAGDFDAPPELSSREFEVLKLIARGKTKPSIARALGISKDTVDTYFRRIYEKLDVSDRAAAVARAVSLGVLLASDISVSKAMLQRQKARRKDRS